MDKHRDECNCSACCCERVFFRLLDELLKHGVCPDKAADIALALAKG